MQKIENYEDIIGQSAAVNEILHWLKKHEKPIIIYGGTGSGKTLIPRIIAKKENLQLIELNPNDVDLLNKVKSVSKEGSLFGKKLIVLDEIEGFNGIDSVFNELKESNHPTILIADDAYNKKLRNIRNECLLIKLRKIPSNIIEKYLIRLCKENNLKIDFNTIKEIAKNSNGDLRSAIIDIEHNLGVRERQKSIFETLDTIFHSKNVNDAINAIRDCDKDLDEIMLWVEENISEEYKDPKQISEAFDLLSKADLFRKKILKNQNFRFKKYSQDMIASITLIKSNNKFTRYKPPEFFRKRKTNEEMENIEKLSRFLHCSKRGVANQIRYIEIFSKELKLK